MKVVALVVGAGFAVLGARSAIHWIRHGLPLRDTTDELLFATFVTGRVGTWWVAAGMFLVFGSISAAGQAYADEARGFTWLLVVFLGLGALQFLAGWFLRARDRSRGTGEQPRPPDAPRVSPPP